MKIDIPEAAAKEEKLLQVTEALELLKDVVGVIIDEMEEDEKDTDSLEDAMNAIHRELSMWSRILKNTWESEGCRYDSISWVL